MWINRLVRRRQRIKFAEFGHELRQFSLPHYGQVEYAQWLHPYETPKPMTESAVDALRHFVQPGDFVIDIGAHTGDTTVPMALAAGPTGCALGLEPNPYVFKILEKNAALNVDTTNIEARCFAATDEDGEFVFHYSDASFCNGGFKSRQKWPFFRRRYPLAVQGRRLEHVLRTEFADRLPRLSYVKVDAEGFDRVILESIRSVLEETRPVIRTEVYRKLVASERHALFDFLSTIGYEIHRFLDGPRPVGRQLTRDDATRSKHFDVLAIPPELSRAAA